MLKTGDGCWNVPLIRNSFNASNAAAILKSIYRLAHSTVLMALVVLTPHEQLASGAFFGSLMFLQNFGFSSGRLAIIGFPLLLILLVREFRVVKTKKCCYGANPSSQNFNRLPTSSFLLLPFSLLGEFHQLRGTSRSTRMYG
ncbi:hypothetical protein ACOSQ3_002642 [Xanthoceras sorbifolium]